MADRLTHRVVLAAAPLEQAPPPRIVSIPNVVIAEVGQWATVEGDGTMTREDLAAAVEATNDPGFRAAPKGKPGHYDERFDGTPGIGRFVNLRLSPDGMQLIADHVGLFEWQRTLVQVAWPNRSVEAYRGMVSTATGRAYGFVITAVALLGVDWPAVATLEDLKLWVTDDGPPEAQEAVAASVRRTRDDVKDEGEDDVAKPPKREPVRAAANIDQVRRDFIAWCDAAQRYTWWIRELWLDPNEVIVDDDQGGLHKVPFTVADGAVTFGQPVPVEVTYIEAAPAAGEAVAASRPSFAQVYANRSDSRPATNDDQEGNTMLTTAQIVELLNLPADTTDEQAQAALTKAREAVTADGGDGGEGEGEGAGDGDGGEGGDGEGTGEGEPTGEPAPQGVAASAAPQGGDTPETVTVTKAQWDEVQSFIAAENARRAAEVKASRDRMVDDAVKAGRITKAERDDWRKALDKAPDENARILASLATKVPVEERGTAAGQDSDGTGDDAYPAAWSRKANTVDMRRG